MEYAVLMQNSHFFSTQWRQNEFESGGTGPAQFFWSCSSTVLALNVQVVVFGKRFRDVQHSLVSFLFAVLLLTMPPVPSHL